MRNEEKNRLTGANLVDAIEAACDGVFFISESDSAIKPFFVSVNDAANASDALIMTGAGDSDISETSADAFFIRLTTDREWHGERERESVRRFRILRDLLHANLSGLRQFRVGRTRVKIFVIGRDYFGNIAGITTNAVET